MKQWGYVCVVHTHCTCYVSNGQVDGREREESNEENRIFLVDTGVHT